MKAFGFVSKIPLNLRSANSSAFRLHRIDVNSICCSQITNSTKHLWAASSESGSRKIYPVCVSCTISIVDCFNFTMSEYCCNASRESAEKQCKGPGIDISGFDRIFGFEPIGLGAEGGIIGRNRFCFSAKTTSPSNPGISVHMKG